MKVTSSYTTGIVHSDLPLDDTVRIFRKALAYLINVVNENWDSVKAIETGALARQQYVERLVHGTKKNESPKYPDFDKLFYKYPSYLRRDTITSAIGAVSSYHSNHDNWVSNGKQGKEPTLQADRNAFPVFYRDDMFVVFSSSAEKREEKAIEADLPESVSISKGKDKDLSPEKKKQRRLERQQQQLEDYQAELAKMEKHYLVWLKVFHNNDWVWTKVTLRKTDIKYLRKHWSHVRASAPVLEKKHGRYSLRFSFEENNPLSKTPIKKQKICAVDLGLNTDATCRIMTADGTILKRKFVDFPSEKDHLYHLLNRIKRFQRFHRPLEVRPMWEYTTRVNDELTKKIARGIMEFAISNEVDCIVFEHLDFRGKKAKGKRKRQRLQMWRKNGVQHMVEHAAHRVGIRISHICAWGTSQLAFDGSGKLQRDKDNHALATFQTGKRYNADLNASYNIGARYFIRELLKPLSDEARSWVGAKVPDTMRRTTCTLASLRALVQLLGTPRQEKSVA